MRTFSESTDGVNRTGLSRVYAVRHGAPAIAAKLSHVMVRQAISSRGVQNSVFNPVMDEHLCEALHTEADMCVSSESRVLAPTVDRRRPRVRQQRYWQPLLWPFDPATGLLRTHITSTGSDMGISHAPSTVFICSASLPVDVPELVRASGTEYAHRDIVVGEISAGSPALRLSPCCHVEMHMATMRLVCGLTMTCSRYVFLRVRTSAFAMFRYRVAAANRRPPLTSR